MLDPAPPALDAAHSCTPQHHQLGQQHSTAPYVALDCSSYCCSSLHTPSHHVQLQKWAVCSCWCCRCKPVIHTTPVRQVAAQQSKTQQRTAQRVQCADTSCCSRVAAFYVSFSPVRLSHPNMGFSETAVPWHVVSAVTKLTSHRYTCTAVLTPLLMQTAAAISDPRRWTTSTTPGWSTGGCCSANQR